MNAIKIVFFIIVETVWVTSNPLLRGLLQHQPWCPYSQHRESPAKNQIQPQLQQSCPGNNPYNIANAMQQVNPSNMNQQLIERLLGANPALQAILNNNPVAEEATNHEACSSGTPQVVNNYFILPPEFLPFLNNRPEFEQKNGLQKRKSSRKVKKKGSLKPATQVDKKTEGRKPKRKELSGLNKLENEERLGIGDVLKVENFEDTNDVNTEKELPKNYINCIAKDVHQDSNSRPTRKKKPKENNLYNEHKAEVEPCKARSRYNSETFNDENLPEHSKRDRINNIERDFLTEDDSIFNHNSEQYVNMHPRKQSLAELDQTDFYEPIIFADVEQFPIENRLPRNPSEEVLITDFRRKYPGIPENVLRDLFVYLKEQIETEQSSISSLSENTDKKKSRGRPKSKNRKISHDERQRMRNNIRAEPNNPVATKTSNINVHTSNNRKVSHPSSKRQPSKETISKSEPSSFQKGSPRTTKKPKTTTAKLKQQKMESKPEFYESNFEMSKEITKDYALKEIDSATTHEQDDNIESEVLLENTTQTDDSQKSDILEKKLSEASIEYGLLKDVSESNASVEIEKSTLNPLPLSTEIYLTELGSEDILPNISENGIIEEYYPEFKDSQPFDSSEYYDSDHVTLRNERRANADDYRVISAHREPISITSYNLNKVPWRRMHNKYRRYRRPISRLPNHKFHETIDYVTKPTINENENLIFRTPPGLELPNFKTRKINKVEHDYDDFEYPIYRYEEPKDHSDVDFEEILSEKAVSYHNSHLEDYITNVTPTNEIRRIKVSSKDKIPKDLETVYANSKVVKYGPTLISNEEDISSSSSLSEESLESDNKFAIDGNTTFIMAKSYAV